MTTLMSHSGEIDKNAWLKTIVEDAGLHLVETGKDRWIIQNFESNSVAESGVI